MQSFLERLFSVICELLGGWTEPTADGLYLQHQLSLREDLSMPQPAQKVGKKDIKSTTSASILSYRSLPIINFSGYPAEVSLYLFLHEQAWGEQLQPFISTLPC